MGHDFWERCLEEDAADTEMAFDHAWRESRSIPGYDTLSLAIREADAVPDPGFTGPESYGRFLRVARTLNRLRDGETINLPCRKLAELFHCQAMTVSRYRRRALSEGYLEVVKEHKFRSAGKGDATEFLFIEQDPRFK
jgi:hypothetical protein